MKIDRRVVLGILVALLLFGVGFILRDFLLAGFVKPMALLLWISNRLVSSIDQAAYWVGLILVILVISLWRYARRHAAPAEEPKENQNATLYSFNHWRTLILLTSDETDQLNFLKRFLRDLLKDLYASQHPSQVSWQVYEDFDKGNVGLPESIKQFLNLDPSANDRPALWQRFQRLSQLPVRLIRHWTKQDEAEYYQSITEVISYMEKQLENEK